MTTDTSDSVRGATSIARSPRFLERYLSGAIVAFAAAVVILLWTAVALLVHQERENAIEQRKIENANLARAFAEHTLRTLNYIDQLSRLVTTQYQRLGMQFDMPRYFEENQVDDKLVINSVITDATGLTVLGSQRGFQPANLADREHVKVHVERDTGRLFIGKPVFARVAKRWSFIATRRVNNPDGSFGGVVGIAVDPFYFSTFYKQADLGKDSLVSLTGGDGIIRARIFGEDQTVGQDVSNGIVFKTYANQQHGTMIATTMSDGVTRIFSFHRVQDYPLFIVIGVSEAMTLAPVVARQRYYFVIAALVSLALLATASALAVFWRRQQRSAEAALGENREQLRQHNEMLVAVSEAQAAYLARGDWKAATARLLRFALEQSESEYGFVGVLVAGPKLRILAHEGVVWDQIKGCDSNARALRIYREDGYLEFSNFDNLFGVAIRTAQPVMANDVSRDPRSGGLRDGHAPMDSFLGLPIRAGDRVIGVVGLANRPGGYDAATLALLEHLQGLAEPVCDSYLIGLEQERLRAEQRQADEQIRAALREKEVLLKEVHHRVKNNLQVISSLLYLQANSIHDGPAREVLRESRERVNSIALVHEQLYRSTNFSAIDFGEHLRELAANVAYSYGAARRGIQLDMKVMEVALQLDVAIPASLIFNELLSNAFKHAFPGSRTGRVEVTLSQAGPDDLILRVRDDGVGVPEGLDWRHPTTLGLKIVRNLTEQIHGKIEVESSMGSTFQISFVANKTWTEIDAAL